MDAESIVAFKNEAVLDIIESLEKVLTYVFEAERFTIEALLVEE